MNDYQVSPIPYVQKRCELRLGLGLAIGAGSTPQSMPLGMNLAGIVGFQASFPSSNLCYHMSLWGQFVGSGAFTQNQGVLSATVGTDEFRSNISSTGDGLPLGTYTVYNPSGATIGFGTTTTTQDLQAYTSATSFTFNYNSKAQLIIFCKGSLSNGSGNLAVIMPGQTATWLAGNIWNSNFYNAVAGLNLKVLRYMDLGLQPRTLETDWADRSQPNLITWRTICAPFGYSIMPYEWMCDLANRLGIDPWICVPARSTSDYVTNMAANIQANLNGARRCYVEHSNEIWNFSNPFGDGTNWTEYLSNPRYTATTPGTTGVFTKTAHGITNGDKINVYRTKENVAVGLDENYLSANGSEVFVEVLTADTFKMHTGSIGGSVVGTEATRQNVIYSRQSEGFTPGTRLNTNYASQCIRNWDAFDSAMGVSRVVHVLGSQFSNDGYTTARLSGVSGRANYVCVAPYAQPYFAGSESDIASTQVTPKAWTRSSGTVSVALFAAGTTPTVNSVKNGTGAIATRTIAVTGSAGTWTSGSAITGLVNGTTYVIAYVFPESATVNHLVYGNVTVSAVASSVDLFPTNAKFAEMSRRKVAQNMQYITSAKAAAGSVPVACYEGNIDYAGAGGWPTAVNNQLLSYLESSEHAAVLGYYLTSLAANGVAFLAFFGLQGDYYGLTNTDADTADLRYVKFASFAGQVQRKTPVTASNITPTNIQSAPSYPYTVATFANAALTYTIVGGNDGNNFDISGANLRMVNGTGVNWGSPTSTVLTIEASDGNTSALFTASFTVGDASHLLDSITAPASMAFGLRLLRVGYAGNCIKVRRSSDNTTQDIGFSGDNLDTAALLTFCGAGNGFIDTWYDQSGNARNITQATQASQPQIVSAGAVITKNGKPAARFAGSQYLTGPTITTAAGIMGSVGVYSLGAVASIDTLGTVQSILDSDDSSNRLFQFRTNTSSQFEVIAFNAGAVAYTGVNTTALSNNTLAVLIAMRDNNITCVTNGNVGTPVAIDTQRNTGAVFTIGRRQTGTQAMTGYVSEALMFPSALGTTDRDTIESNQGTYFGITVV